MAATVGWFDGSYPPDVLFPTPVVVPVTGATAGTPGSWEPPNATPLPTSVAEANALGLSLGAAWASGQYVVLDNPSHTHTYWTGTAFASGNAPAPAPTVDTLAPATGPAAGGTAIAITGTGLTGSTGVGFDNVPGTAFGVVSDTRVNVVSPAHAAGAVDVVVAHPSGNATKADGYEYT